MRVNVHLDDRDLQRGIENMRRRFPLLLRGAVRRAGTTARAEMARAVSEDSGLPVTRCKREIRVNELGDLGVQLEITGNRIPLIDFAARGPEPSRGQGRGVSYRLPGGRGRDPHAFIATMQSGHRGVFRRTGKGRLPVIQLHGPSLVNVFRNKLDFGAERARAALEDQVRQVIAFALSR